MRVHVVVKVIDNDHGHKYLASIHNAKKRKQIILLKENNIPNLTKLLQVTYLLLHVDLSFICCMVYMHHTNEMSIIRYMGYL